MVDYYHFKTVTMQPQTPITRDREEHNCKQLQKKKKNGAHPDFFLFVWTHQVPTIYRSWLHVWMSSFQTLAWTNFPAIVWSSFVKEA